MLSEINLEKALIFRITHRDNLPWILSNGLHCRKSDINDQNFVDIGSPDLIEKRQHRSIAHPPGGTLSDYIPFYFTPLSIMAFNIHTGHGGIRQRHGSEIVILVTSLPNLVKDAVSFLFTDRHASLIGARFSSQLRDLDRIDWRILQNRDFNRDNDDIGKASRYQAEALVHRYLPTSSLLGIACYNRDQKAWVHKIVTDRKLGLKVFLKRGWYF